MTPPPRWAAWLAWSQCAVSVVSATIGLALFLQSGHIASDPARDHGGSALFTLDMLVFSLVGALIASRRRSNPVGWLFCFSGLTAAIGLNGLGYGYAYDSLEGPVGPLPGAAWFAWFAATFENAGLYASALAFLLFPTGRPPSRRWWPMVWLTVGLGVLACLSAALRPGPLANFPAIDNPLGLSGVAGELAVVLKEGYGGGLAPLVLLVGTASLLVRLRRARGVERQQLKWVAYAVTLAPAFFLAMFVAAKVWPDAPADPFVSQLLGWVGNSAWALAVAGLPVSIGIAILRHRLYDIDLIIRRTLIYGALTAGLGLGYWGSVVLLQQVLRPLTQGSDLAVVGSTLAVAALFQPLRRRIQETVDRRFYRRRYDAARTLEDFSSRLREQINLESLKRELVAVVGQTVQPAHVSLWLRPQVK